MGSAAAAENSARPIALDTGAMAICYSTYPAFEYGVFSSLGGPSGREYEAARWISVSRGQQHVFYKIGSQEFLALCRLWDHTSVHKFSASCSRPGKGRRQGDGFPAVTGNRLCGNARRATGWTPRGRPSWQREGPPCQPGVMNRPRQLGVTPVDSNSTPTFSFGQKAHFRFLCSCAPPGDGLMQGKALCHYGRAGLPCGSAGEALKHSIWLGEDQPRPC